MMPELLVELGVEFGLEPGVGFLRNFVVFFVFEYDAEEFLQNLMSFAGVTPEAMFTIMVIVNILLLLRRIWDAKKHNQSYCGG